MVKEELVTGLKNAIVRGEGLEKAINSLLSAGYNSQEVHEAADTLNLGVIGEVSKQIMKNETAKPLNSAEIKPTYKLLPSVSSEFPITPIKNEKTISKPNNNLNKNPHKIPGWLIGLLIFFGFLIVFLILLSIFGTTILDVLFKK